MEVFEQINFKYFYKSKLFIMTMTLLVLIIYSNSFIQHSSVIRGISSLFSSEADSNMKYFFQVLASVQFQVITRFFTIFFSL